MSVFHAYKHKIISVIGKYFVFFTYVAVAFSTFAVPQLAVRKNTRYPPVEFFHTKNHHFAFVGSHPRRITII